MKTAVFQLRLSPEKKAEWLSRAGKAGMKLGPWIESMCDRSENGFQENLSRGIPGVLAGDGRPNEKVHINRIPEPAERERREFLSRAHATNCTCMACRGK